MAFTVLKPAPAAVAAGVPQVRTVKRKDGLILMLSIPTTGMAKAKWFTPPEKLVVMIGTGDDAGKLMLLEESNATAGHGIKVTVMKHTCLLRLPRQDWMPEIDFKPGEMAALYGDKEIRLTLPEWAWNKDRQKAIDLARRQSRPEAERKITGRGAA
jgi:hypothetical protein